MELPQFAEFVYCHIISVTVRKIQLRRWSLGGIMILSEAILLVPSNISMGDSQSSDLASSISKGGRYSSE